ncbi:uncharacterized protein LOC136092018 [Hydra vulgaris]|uniref:Uncharacterized protein LOC136092018 n=1 Tax=Hydra vulgaris TaxID=6087 RepID=A0ABM4DMM4_HYDVU
MIKNPKLLYSYINNQPAVKDTIKALKGENGKTTQNSKDIADILNKSFQAAFVKEDVSLLLSFDLRTIETFIITNEDSTYEDVYLRLKNLKDTQSSGVDNLHSAILKNCVSAFAIPLAYIFKESFKTSKLPVQFRSTNITPLYKKGEKILAGNYQPVSFTSIAYKIMEVIIRCKIETFLYKFKVIVKQQHGFVKNKSCFTNLLETLNFISTAFENGKPNDVIFLWILPGHLTQCNIKDCCLNLHLMEYLV